MQKGITIFRWKIFVPKNFVEEPFMCFRKIVVPENVRDKRGGGYHDFLSKLFCLTVPKNFVGEPFCVSEKFWYRKTLWIRGGRWREGVSRFSVENLSRSTEKIRRGTLLCFRKFLVLKNVRENRAGRVSQFCVEIVFSHSTETFRRGTLLCFRKVLASKSSMDKREGGGREYHDFPSKIFWILVPKNFVGEPFHVWEKF